MAQGISFSIPVNTARWVVSEILTQGHVRRGYLGISGQRRQLDRRVIRFFNLASEHAVEVVTVDPAGPATRSGIHEGDLIVLINEQVVASVDDLHRFLAEWPIGQPATLTVIRGSERLQLQVISVAVP